MSKKKTCAVIGAGVVGLAIARALALAGHEVIVLESQGSIGTQTSSRNSEVIHAGIYYAHNSLKARLCLQGRQMLYAYCRERQIAHQQIGKLIVATTPEQVEQLTQIKARAQINGVSDLQFLSQQQACHLETQLYCLAALLSPSTGIIDSHSLMLSFQGDLENAGGVIAFASPVVKINCKSGGLNQLQTQDGSVLEADLIVNTAGHGAISLSHNTQGLDSKFIAKPYYLKGQYFTLSGKAPFKHLIYPIPKNGGFGIHLTLDLAGQARFGPDAQWTNTADDLSVNPDDAKRFEQAIRQYWPQLPEGRLQPDYAGIRPNIAGPEALIADFSISGEKTHGIRGLVNLYGIDSPGLTSSLAIAQYVVNISNVND